MASMAAVLERLGFQCCHRDDRQEKDAEGKRRTQSAYWDELSHCGTSHSEGYRHAPRFTAFDGFGDGQVWDDIICELWPALKEYLETNVLRGIVEPALQQLVWARMRMEACSLGDEPPRIVGARTFRRSEDDKDDSEERTVELAFDLNWMSEEMDISLLIETGIRATVTQMSIRGTYCLELRNFMPESPLLGGMSLYFMNEPEVSITFGGVLNAIDGRLCQVQQIIEEQLAACLVLPNRIAIHLSDNLSFYELQFPAAEGILEVDVRQALQIPLDLLDGVLGRGTVVVKLRLGAERWCSAPQEVGDSGTASCKKSSVALFCVDAFHGQSLVAELWSSETKTRKESLLCSSKLSPENLMDGTKAGRTKFPLEMISDDQPEGRDVPESPLLDLRSTFRPLFLGSPADQGTLQPLKDGVCGLLVVILDSFQDLATQLAGVGIGLTARVGNASKDSSEVSAERFTLEDVAEEKAEQLNFLLTKEHPLLPADAAWVLGLPPKKAEAFARGSVQAQFGSSLRVYVQDPLKEELVLELWKAGKQKQIIATFATPLRRLLERPDWTLPLEERFFSHVEPGYSAPDDAVGPMFKAKIQLFGLRDECRRPRMRSRFATEDQLLMRSAELKEKPSLFPHFGFRDAIRNGVKKGFGVSSSKSTKPMHQRLVSFEECDEEDCGSGHNEDS